MQLTVWPVVGLFARRELVFIWSDNLLRVLGCSRGELSARALPVSFDSETDFCRCCLLLTYSSDASGNLHIGEADSDTPAVPNGLVPTLSSLAYHIAVSNLDAVPENLVIPPKVSHQLYGSQGPVVVSIRIWPSMYASQFGANPVMKVKGGLIFSEFVYLIREHFQLPINHAVKLYHNYKPVQMNELVTSRIQTMDCFVISYEGENLSGCYGSVMEEVDTHAMLVVSLVGHDVQNVEANLEMKLRDFDTMLRKRFMLKSDSFLIILAEDDFAPQYTASDNWKFIYPFTLPESSFGAGLRRSFRKFSQRQQNCHNSLRSSQSRCASPRQLPGENSFTSQVEKVMALLSSNSRQFPSNAGRFDFTLDELYESMPMYQLTLEQCGIHPYAIIQVFEVTGPSIPIKFRVLSEHNQTSIQSRESGQAYDLLPVSRHANIMDINPKWSIHTFLQYVDAVISPAAGVRRKRISLKDHFIDDSEDLSSLTLGELLDYWKPVWWCHKEGRKRLMLKDLDPAEFLLVEKLSTAHDQLRH